MSLFRLVILSLRHHRALSLLFCFGSGPLLAVADPAFLKGPYLQFPAPDKATIIWEGNSDHPGSLEFGPGEALERRVDGIRPAVMRSETSAPVGTATYYLYKISVSGLHPGSVYSYRAQVGNAQSPTRTFRTLDPGASRTRFIVYGDSRSDPKMHASLTANFKKHQPEFILHSGDLVAKGKDYSLWSREFFTPAAAVIDHIPLFSVIGNHEQDGTNYLNYFDLPGKKLWYSFDSGPVHVLALDFRSSKASEEQFRFAREDLMRSTAPWKIVIVHVPIYNIGGHASSWGHEAYLPMFHAAKVDLVLSGHSHLYERFRPIAPRRSLRKWAITHVTTGGGGAGLHTTMRHPALLVQETTNHFMRFEATTESLRGVAIRLDGTLIDQFELEKPGRKPDPVYLATAYPEESLNLFYAASPLLTPRAEKIPTPTEPARIQFTLPALKHYSNEVARLEISLTPESARHYELAGAPLRVTTAAPGKTNLVFAEIRATGLGPISEKSKELTPPLVFQAAVQSRRGATLAYGGKVKLAELTPPPPAELPERVAMRSPKDAALRQ